MKHYRKKSVNIDERNKVVVGGKVNKTSVFSRAKKLGKLAEKSVMFTSNCMNLYNKM